MFEGDSLLSSDSPNKKLRLALPAELFFAGFIFFIRLGQGPISCVIPAKAGIQ